MILSCPSCPKTYDVPAAALPPGGREVACSACGAVWFERGAMARAAAAGAAGADVVFPGGDVIEAEFQPVGVTEPRPAPVPAEPDALPAPSPAKAQQTALTIAYEPVADDEEVAREAVRILAEAGQAKLRRARDRVIGAAGALLGTALSAWSRRRDQAAPKPATPGEAAARATRARMQARAVNAMTPGRALGWAVWAMASATVLFVLVAKPAQVQAVFPPSQKLYGAFAEPTAAPGLRVGGTLRTYAVSSQGPAVMVAGVVSNDGAAALVPVVTMTVEGPDGATSQPVALPAVALPPGGERPFAVRALVPEGVSAVRLSVVAGTPVRDGLTLQAQGDAWGGAGHAGPPRLGGAPHSPPR